MKLSGMIEFKKINHHSLIEELLAEDVEEKIPIYTGREENLVSKRILTMFSPVFRRFTASLPCSSTFSIILDDCDTVTVTQLLEILVCGVTKAIQNDSNKQVAKIKELANRLEINIIDIINDNTVSEFETTKYPLAIGNNTTEESITEENLNTDEENIRKKKIDELKNKQKDISKEILSSISLFRSGVETNQCSQCPYILDIDNVVEHCKEHIMELNNKIEKLSTDDSPTNITEPTSDVTIEDISLIDKSSNEVENTDDDLVIIDYVADGGEPLERNEHIMVRDRSLANHRQKVVNNNASKKEKEGMDSDVLSCYICEYGTPSKDNLEKHYSEEHYSEELKDICEELSRDLKCTLCDYVANGQGEVTSHIGIKHGYINKILQANGYKPMPFQKIRKSERRINQSNSTSSSPPRSKEKVQSKESADITGSHTEKFECSQCGKSFSQKGNLATHRKIHTGVKSYLCDSCNKSFTQKSHLNYHQKKYHT